MDGALRSELLALMDADQQARRGWSGLSADARRAALGQDRLRAARVAEIVEARGWPGRSLVGEDGAIAAWLLVQHADHDVPLQERCLRLLTAAVADGEARASDLACLTDRVCVNRGRPQVYGTQFHGAGESFGPHPIEDPDHLNERRQAVGLGPFADYTTEMRALKVLQARPER